MTYGHWHYPTEIIAREGCTNKLADYCRNTGIHRPLLITDHELAETKMVRNIISGCCEADLPVELFSHIQSNPTGANVEAGIKHFVDGRHDGIIALGGGSSIDVAKAVALVARQAFPLWDFVHQDENWQKADPEQIAPVIAIPTTAGTGSEVGRASIIKDELEHKKKIIYHPKMMPKLVLLDPILTLDLPPELTAATGMDALSHSLEALCTHTFHPMSDAIALESMRIISHYLPVAYMEGQNLNARFEMQIAACMAATAFQKGVGATHALSHTLGAIYDKHHGLLNAILLPYVLSANKDHINEKMIRMGRYLALPRPDFHAVMAWLLSLRTELNIPHTLAAIDIDSKEAERIGEIAASDPSAASNPIHFTAEQYAEIFTNAVKGTLIYQ
ncbi:Alcohol dehydrogenase [Photobacterium marinum]|uniref:Alcohol dehydrogenase n=1 Tax=Photobacterium marinum TaxID=1056511 RepID=L8J615_9GAMM|nr:iron-containing alcohol dehydrogenase [Photobacterium marinum]ELR64255.1 Alcohol dehydrogenase [Photobacterium marinum]